MSPDPQNNMAPTKSIMQCNNWVTWVRPGDHGTIARVTGKIEAFTARPRAFYEPIQVLRYDPGQYYRLHVDNSYPHDPNPRKATFQVYLTDVEEGGETVFPKLGLKFRPKQGRAVYWYNFDNSHDSDKKPSADLNTVHEGVEIVKGQKWALTQWVKLWPLNSQLPLSVVSGSKLPASSGY
jgi:prolyl 4-hydroxylase